jgi:hypothetical protein
MKRVSILNLGNYIPQRDVIKMILKKLDRIDWKLVWAAHDEKKRKKLIKSNIFFEHCMAEGRLKIVKWLYAKNPSR